MPDDKTIQVDDAQITAEIKEKVIADVTPELTEKITADVTEKVTKEVTEAATKAAKDDLVKKIQGDKPVDENASPWTKEGRTPLKYEEVAEYGATLAEKRIEAKLKAQNEAKAKQDEEAKKSSEEKQKQWNDYWEGQLKSMTDEGKIPAVDDKIQAKLDKKEVLTEQEKQDPGLQARAELFTKAKEVKDTNLELVWYKHIKDKKPVGATAPVLGSHRATTSSNKDEWTWEELHNAKNFQDLIPKT